jgi:two-component system NtrC family sensor kinase
MLNIRRRVAEKKRAGAPPASDYLPSRTEPQPQPRSPTTLAYDDFNDTNGECEVKRAHHQGDNSQVEKMRALATLARGIAHEFNNILAIIIGYVDLTVQSGEVSSSALKNLDIAQAAAVRGVALVKRLRAFVKCDAGEKKAVNLKSVVDQALRLAKNDLEEAGVKLEVGHGEDTPLVEANAALLLEVVANLIENARHAMARSAVKKLAIETGVRDGNPFVRIADTGCGIPDEDVSRIFEPFYTTKGALGSGETYDGKAHGIGLGLSICHSIVNAHGGEITVRSQVDKGTSFTVLLPAAATVGTGRKACFVQGHYTPRLYY